MREGNGAEMALGSWHMETLKLSLQPGCCRVSTRPWVPQRGPRGEVCSQCGAHRSTHSLLPCRPQGGSKDVSGETGTRTGRDHPLALPAQRRGSAHPEGFQSHQPSATEAPGSGITQSSGQRRSCSAGAGPGGSRSLWHSELPALPPAVASPHFKCPPPPHAAVFHAGASHRAIKVGKDTLNGV